MTDIQEKNPTSPVETDQEKHFSTEHRELATPALEKEASDIDGEQADHSEHFHSTSWTLKDRLAALSLSGLYVGE